MDGGALLASASASGGVATLRPFLERHRGTQRVEDLVDAFVQQGYYSLGPSPLFACWAGRCPCPGPGGTWCADPPPLRAPQPTWWKSATP